MTQPLKWDILSKYEHNFVHLSLQGPRLEKLNNTNGPELPHSGPPRPSKSLRGPILLVFSSFLGNWLELIV